MRNRKTQLFKYKDPIYKNWWFWIISVILLLICLLLVPILINEAYKNPKGYVTFWGASDVLSFYAILLSGIITFVALFITIKHNWKITNKQIKLAMAQTKLPYFKISSIHDNDGNIIRKNQSGHWIIKSYFEDNFKLINICLSKFNIRLTNVGDGAAFNFVYRVNMFAEIFDEENFIQTDKDVEISYDLAKNLEDKYVNHFMQEAYNKTTSIEVFSTYIEVSYRNIFGVSFVQVITLDISYGGSNEVILDICEISPQKIVDIID